MLKAPPPTRCHRLQETRASCKGNRYLGFRNTSGIKVDEVNITPCSSVACIDPISNMLRQSATPCPSAGRHVAGMRYCLKWRCLRSAACPAVALPCAVPSRDTATTGRALKPATTKRGGHDLQWLRRLHSGCCVQESSKCQCWISVKFDSLTYLSDPPLPETS